MIRFFKQLFCKHDYKCVSQSVSELKGDTYNKTYWCSKWYIDSYICTKCRKAKIDTIPFK